ncbi:MAG: transposase [Chloroflexi bacterium]|nr:transposase [Chloroflexota bacterium]
MTCFNKFLTTLKNHWQAIINYFIRRATSGFVEGINNKIQTLKRRCYGIRRVDSLFRRIWLDLQGVRRFLSPPDVLSTP